MNKKITTAIVVVVVLVALFLVFNFVTNKHFQSPEFTSQTPETVPLSSTDSISGNQRVFHGDNQRFDFKYPLNLSRSLGGAPLNSNLNSEIIVLKSAGSISAINDIQLWVTPDQTSLNEYIAKIMKNTEFTSSDETVAGVPAKRLSVKGQLFSEGNQIFFVKDGYGYRWIAYKSRDVDGGLNMIPILNEILSTFRFTK